jgi:hypothetical protein
MVNRIFFIFSVMVVILNRRHNCESGPRQEGLGCTTPEPIDILSKGNIVFFLKRVVMAYLNQIAYNFDSSINTEHTFPLNI